MPRGHIPAPWPGRRVMASLPPPPFPGTAAAVTSCTGDLPPPPPTSGFKTRFEREREAGHSKFKISLLLAVLIHFPLPDFLVNS